MKFIPLSKASFTSRAVSSWPRFPMFIFPPNCMDPSATSLTMSPVLPNLRYFICTLPPLSLDLTEARNYCTIHNGGLSMNTFSRKVEPDVAEMLDVLFRRTASEAGPSYRAVPGCGNQGRRCRAFWAVPRSGQVGRAFRSQAGLRAAFLPGVRYFPGWNCPKDGLPHRHHLRP